MLRGQWRFFIVTVLMSSIQSTLAEEAWLVIFSDLPSAMISVDGAYRGVTPQHLEDALRVKVAEGICEVGARVQIGGRTYTQRQTITTSRDQETVVQFDWNQKSPPVSVTATTVPPVIGVEMQPRLLTKEIEVPGRNF